MPSYVYLVREQLTLDADGNAIGERLITLQNPTSQPVRILVQELEEFFPENATNFAVVNLPSGEEAESEIEDHHYARRLRWPVLIEALPAGEEHQYRVTYTRSFVAHIQRGYLHITVGYSSVHVSRYELSLVAPTQLHEIHLKTLRPPVDDATSQFDWDKDRTIHFPAREVSMNKRFYLEVAMEAIGEVEVPELPVVRFVMRQMRNGEWFPEGWEE